MQCVVACQAAAIDHTMQPGTRQLEVGAMILAPVGAGKTAITLTAMADMVKHGHVGRWLVLAPKRVCTDVWPVEALKWAPKLIVTVAVGTPIRLGTTLSVLVRARIPRRNGIRSRRATSPIRSRNATPCFDSS